jgi:hypothetical protein
MADSLDDEFLKFQQELLGVEMAAKSSEGEKQAEVRAAFPTQRMQRLPVMLTVVLLAPRRVPCRLLSGHRPP